MRGSFRRRGTRRVMLLLVLLGGGAVAVLRWRARADETRWTSAADAPSWPPPAAPPPAAPPPAAPPPVAADRTPAPAAPAPAKPVQATPVVAAAMPSRTVTVDAAGADPDGEPQAGPFPGSALPTGDGSAPSPEYTLKGNASSMLCHSPESPYYRRTRAEVWFRTEQDAVAAGFRMYQR